MRSVRTYQDIKTPEEINEERQRYEQRQKLREEQEQYLAEIYRDSHDPYSESLTNEWDD